jgi:hypothetical protein
MDSYAKRFFKDMLERAVVTFAEVLLGFLGAGLGFGEINWGMAFSVAGVATVASILKSIAARKIGDEDTASLVETN